MSTHINKPMEWVPTTASPQRYAPRPEVPAPAKRRWTPDTLRTIAIMAITGSFLLLSAAGNYFFFTKLLVANAIIGMLMLLRAVRNPVVPISKGDKDRAYLN